MAYQKQKRERRRSDAMLRAVGLTVSLVVGIAAPAAANHSGHGGKGIAAAAQQDAAAPGNRPLVAERSTPVQVTNGWSGAHLFCAHPWRACGRSRRPDARAGHARAERREGSGSSVPPWVGAEKPALGLPVSERLSFAVGYQHVEGEDRWRPYGEAGPVDYDSQISSWAWLGDFDHAAAHYARNADPRPPDNPGGLFFRQALPPAVTGDEDR